MEGCVKLFCSKESKLNEDINDYINQYKLDNYIYLTPTSSTMIIIKGIGMIPENTIKSLVSFSQVKASEEEIKQINCDKEKKARFWDNIYCCLIRKNLETGGITFCVFGEYIDIYKVFGINISKDKTYITVYERADVPPSISIKLHNKYPNFLAYIHEYVIPELEKILL